MNIFFFKRLKMQFNNIKIRTKNEIKVNLKTIKKSKKNLKEVFTLSDNLSFISIKVWVISFLNEIKDIQ